MLAHRSMDDTKLIGLFTELTGESDSTARSVLMYMDMLESDYFPTPPPPTATPGKGAVEEQGDPPSP